MENNIIILPEELVDKIAAVFGVSSPAEVGGRPPVWAGSTTSA